jgi:hypothetical protein
MPVYSPLIESQYSPASIKFNKDFPPKLMRGSAESQKINHDKLLSYLLARLRTTSVARSQRAIRYARIDRQISTWQQLSNTDSQRRAKEDSTGQSQAIHMNLPLGEVHLEDMASYYAGVFAPQVGSFFKEPKPMQSKVASGLINKMNADSKKARYYTNLISALRRFLKYNIGGFHVEWCTKAGSADNKDGWNDICSIDPYNHLWDPSIKDPAMIRCDAEWSATVDVMNQKALLDAQTSGLFYGVGEVVLGKEEGWTAGNPTTKAEFYKYPPNQAGITDMDQTTGNGKVDWTGYGASLASDVQISVPGWERVDMYIWINPFEFNLTDTDSNNLVLYRFSILGGVRVVSIEQVYEPAAESDPGLAAHYLEIPHYCGFLNVDDMGEATRSVAELLAPFASFGSFLMNAHVDAARSSIFGLTVYDPMGIDLSTIPNGETAARIPTKQPGRDVRAIVQNLSQPLDTQNTMQALGGLLQIMDRFFPAQAMPSQVAGIDRAVQSQVAAVLQGVSRRLHMIVRTLDDDVMGPTRFAAYTNIARYQAVPLDGLTDDDVLLMLGSGLQQLNTEAAANDIKELIMTILQNPQAAQQYDVLGLLNWWSGMKNIPDSLESFIKQQPAQPGQPGAPTGAAPPVPDSQGAAPTAY